MAQLFLFSHQMAVVSAPLPWIHIVVLIFILFIITKAEVMVVVFNNNGVCF